MKKSNFFVLSIAALLALGACGGKGGNNNNSSNNEGKNEYVDPEVELNDVATPNMQISFNDVENNCMINEKAQRYIDAMEAQEKTLDRPYHFSSLYGPDDYAKIAAAADKGDGTSYADADKGGVDVCEYLNRNDYSNDCKNYPIKLQWDNGGETFDSAKLKFWSTEDQSDIREIALGANATSAELPNLFRARKYRVQIITDDGQASNSFEFKTGDYPRTITMGGVHNVRDCGGFVSSYGVRTTQGLIYRGYYIDDKTNGHGKNYSEEVEKVHQEVMKIGVELDVQENSSSSGNYGRTQSCLGGADYTCLTLVSYENFLKESSYKNLPAIFKLLAHADEKHVYFHCWGGADRTGMLDFFLSAILGVSYTDLIEEFELTTQTNNKRCHMHNSSSAHFPKFLNAFINEWDGYDDEKTVNENCEKWLLEVPQVDPDDIQRFREIMLPGYADGELDANTLIPEYTAGDEWKSDELAHWKEANEDSNVKCNWHRHDGAECSICGHGGSGSQGGGDTGNDSDFNEILSRVWTKTAELTNADGKPFEQIKDNSKNKVGVRILQKNISPDSEGTFDSDNKLPSDGKTVKYRVKAPKAADYQMIMCGRVSDETKKLRERGIVIKLNGTAVSVDFGERDGGLNGRGDNEFVICPTIHLTGNEDVIEVACKNYRVGFAQDAWLVLSEH